MWFAFKAYSIEAPSRGKVGCQIQTERPITFHLCAYISVDGSEIRIYNQLRLVVVNIPYCLKGLLHSKWCRIWDPLTVSACIKAALGGFWSLLDNTFQSMKRLFLEGQRVPPASQLFSNVRGSLGTILALRTAWCRCHKTPESSIFRAPDVQCIGKKSKEKLG